MQTSVQVERHHLTRWRPQLLFGRFAVRIEDGRLEGTLWGEPVDVERHAPACEPKGATHTALRVAKDQDGAWSAAVCVVDV
jgi:tRNA nucleotidyltransferase (CCA-adding enzyme)